MTARSPEMWRLTINGQPRDIRPGLSVADLLEQLGYQPRRVAVEVNQAVIPAAQHASQPLHAGDAIEIVTLVGGGSASETPADKPLVVGKFRFQSRLITGTG